MTSQNIVCTVRRSEFSARRTVDTHATVSKWRCQTPTKHTTNISEPLQISVKYSSTLPDDGSHTIRNMLEWFLILCLLNFYTT